MVFVTSNAMAQEIESLQSALMRSSQNTVDDNKANVARSLSLNSGQSEASAGFFFLSSGGGASPVSLGSATALPLGYSYGLGEAIEVGGGFDLTFNPFHGATLVSNLNAYGQYAVMPGKLAAQLSVTVAGGVASAHALNIQIDVPILLRLLDEKLLLYLQPRGLVSVGVSNLAPTIGGFSQGALALYKITPEIFANVESTLYFAFGSGAVSTPTSMQVRG